tara:strand:- start:976 stop:1407 length:432 start_codon:yes stop_codon:yes gene_type:complete
MKLSTNTEMFIHKNQKEVFDTIHIPEKLIAFFSSYSSTLNKTDYGYYWKVSPNKSHMVKIRLLIPSEKNEIQFEWEFSGETTLVEINIEPVSSNTCLIKVTETGWEKDSVGLEKYNRQMKVWSYFVIRLKLYLEHGLNLQPKQ